MKSLLNLLIPGRSTRSRQPSSNEQQSPAILSSEHDNMPGVPENPNETNKTPSDLEEHPLVETNPPPTKERAAAATTQRGLRRATKTNYSDDYPDFTDGMKKSNGRAKFGSQTLRNKPSSLLETSYTEGHFMESAAPFATVTDVARGGDHPQQEDDTMGKHVTENTSSANLVQERSKRRHSTRSVSSGISESSTHQESEPAHKKPKRVQKSRLVGPKTKTEVSVSLNSIVKEAPVERTVGKKPRRASQRKTSSLRPTKQPDESLETTSTEPIVRLPVVNNEGELKNSMESEVQQQDTEVVSIQAMESLSTQIDKAKPRRGRTAPTNSNKGVPAIFEQENDKPAPSVSCTADEPHDGQPALGRQRRVSRTKSAQMRSTKQTGKFLETSNTERSDASPPSNNEKELNHSTARKIGSQEIELASIQVNEAARKETDEAKVNRGRTAVKDNGVVSVIAEQDNDKDAPSALSTERKPHHARTARGRPRGKPASLQSTKEPEAFLETSIAEPLGSSPHLNDEGELKHSTLQKTEKVSNVRTEVDKAKLKRGRRKSSGGTSIVPVLTPHEKAEPAPKRPRKGSNSSVPASGEEEIAAVATLKEHGKNSRITKTEARKKPSKAQSSKGRKQNTTRTSSRSLLMEKPHLQITLNEKPVENVKGVSKPRESKRVVSFNPERSNNAKRKTVPCGRRGLAPMELAPPPPPIPDGLEGRWTYNAETRLFLANFRDVASAQLPDQDINFLLELMARDDLTVVSEGLWSPTFEKLLELEYLEAAFGNQIHHKFRMFSKKTEGGYEEKPDGLSMRATDFFKYLEMKMTEDGDCKKLFRFSDGDGKRHEINADNVSIYMIDCDLPKILPLLHDKYIAHCKMRAILPGGEMCMMSAVSLY